MTKKFSFAILTAVLLMMTSAPAQAQNLSKVVEFSRLSDGTYMAISETDTLTGVPAWQYLEAKTASYLVKDEGKGIYLATTVERTLHKVVSATLNEAEDSAVVKMNKGEYRTSDLRWLKVQPAQTVVKTVFAGYITREGKPYAIEGEWYLSIKDENIGKYSEISLEGKPLATTYIPDGAKVVVIPEDVAKTLLPGSAAAAAEKNEKKVEVATPTSTTSGTSSSKKVLTPEELREGLKSGKISVKII